MCCLLIAAISRLLLCTFFPLSKIIGFKPSSISLSAANRPAGPEPTIATSSLLLTSW